MQDDTTREIPLTRGMVAIVDAEDYDRVSAFRWHATRNSRNHRWYAARNVRENGNRSKVKMHRFIMDAPAHLQVDHRNDDGLDNRRNNLRLATQSQNQRNQRAIGGRNKTGFKGVSQRKNGYIARIHVDNKPRQAGGLWATPEQAARAYDKKAKELHGEFARLNFPEGESNE